jgi:hypothetical protein
MKNTPVVPNAGKDTAVPSHRGDKTPVELSAFSAQNQKRLGGYFKNLRYAVTNQ